MNQEQVKSAIRWLVATFGGVVAGFFAAKGWFTVDDVLTVLNSGTFLGIATSIVGIIWGLFVHTKSNATAVVDAMPEVAGVVTKQSPEGLALAEAAGSPTVAPEGTVQATRIAKLL